MHRYFLELSYNGANYSGWQIQKNAVSVQEKVNEALSAYTNSNIETTGCGRTDTGVHASQFFLHFDCSEENINEYNALYSLNGMLPYDISLFSIRKVSDDAHARFDATERTYHYFLSSGKNVFMQDYAMPVFKPLNIDLLNECCNIMMAHVDFECFCKSNSQNKTTICKIIEAEWKSENGYTVFEISADRFLRGMVRAIVGTLLNVSSGKISVNDFKKILESKDRKLAGASAPPHALYLTSVKYPYLKIERPVVFPFSIK
ncbi:MAG TPA: tRNA pseudouridine(38-40) synthase TruA [Bacteroidia bacterium]|nr:tRNA pseudouridine(38-40) synthase TruA [Bacteroidia bacterium]HNU34112.1 tRNA pseudouridine(38-40) synthase TruA [Bacteroidia bacterium]